MYPLLGTYTFSSLPVATSVVAGTQAFCSDLGMVYSNGVSWLPMGGVFTPTAPTAVAIQSAINAAGVAGGGIVKLPTGVIPLSQSLTPVAGVYLEGVEPVLNTTLGIPDQFNVTFAGGTILAPTGAFPAITWNTTVLGVQGSQGAFAATAINNIGFKNLGFQGGTYGIFAGATNNGATWWSEFENLYFIGCTQWGMNITNYQHCSFKRNFSFNCINGQFHGVDCSGALLIPGNSTVYDLYNVIPSSSATNMLSRGISFVATGTVGASNNQYKMDRIQSNNFNRATTTQAATMVNAQATFTVTDGTKWAIGMPVAVSTTANGFTVGIPYFVASAAGNVISLSLTNGGAAINATGNAAINVINQGFPAFEMIGLPGATFLNVVIDNLDVEGGGTAAVVLQNCGGCSIEMQGAPLVSQSTWSVVGLGYKNSKLMAPQIVNTYFDGNSTSQAMQFFGSRNANPSSGYMGSGIWFDSVTGNVVLSLGSPFATASTGELTFIPSVAAGILMPKVMGIGQLPKAVSGNPVALTNMNLCYVNVSNPGSYTLPTVTASIAGCWLEIFNNSGAAQTVTTDGTQLFNNVAGRTVLTLANGASVRLSAYQTTGGATYTWVLVGSSATMTAGAIAAPT